MKIPDTPDELFDAFSRYGYRGTIERFRLLSLSQRFTIDEITWTAWRAHEVGERTIYYRKRHLRALLCAASGTSGQPPAY